jgi:AraC-like DNA-binding protein
MSTDDMTGLARVPLAMLYAVESRYGIDGDELRRLSGFRAEELSDPDARVPVSKIWALWHAVIDRVDDPALGLHLGEHSRAREFGLLGYAIYHSGSLRRALVRIARYSRIVNEALEVHVLDNGECCGVVVDKEPRLDALRHPIDCRLATIVAFAREITAESIVPCEVHFPYPRPQDISHHQRLFRCPLHFEASASKLLFEPRDLDRPVVAADETLTGYLDQLAEGISRALSESVTFRQRVCRAIWSDLSGGKPSVQQVAARLGVSTRTLQRRLEEEGTSFAQELDRLRQDLATRLLQNRSLAVYEVAFLLGYAEPSTFYRAFRRWKNVSPHEYRRRSAG